MVPRLASVVFLPEHSRKPRNAPTAAVYVVDRSLRSDRSGVTGCGEARTHNPEV